MAEFFIYWFCTTHHHHHLYLLFIYFLLYLLLLYIFFVIFYNKWRHSILESDYKIFWPPKKPKNMKKVESYEIPWEFFRQGTFSKDIYISGKGMLLTSKYWNIIVNCKSIISSSTNIILEKEFCNSYFQQLIKFPFDRVIKTQGN